MGSYHVLYGSGDNGSNYSVEVEYHIPVPNEANLAGTINIRAAVAQDSAYDKTSNQATAVELTQLANGEIVKIVEPYRLNKDRPLVDHRAKVRARYDELITNAINTLKGKYAFYQFSETKGVNFP